ncbi:hypothetical protein POM88_030385 [Heracleum sosnowskyi]|uniref:Uncharacterized protein n=1 Tax=Heracleum sosnowskyi TaxID=360622 RepID=A0AAD8MIK4_9APIA|nr:hypothetical protein POM88_030385 [Heracleum sosnowskyi]
MRSRTTAAKWDDQSHLIFVLICEDEVMKGSRMNTTFSKFPGVEHTTDAEPKNLYAENAVHTVEETFPTNCSPVTSWMITFRLKDERTTSIYLGAHPTSHASAKGCDPDEEDTGLYFFPDNVNRSDEYSFDLNGVPSEHTSDSNYAEVPRDSDLNDVPPEPTSNSKFLDILT